MLRLGSQTPADIHGVTTKHIRAMSKMQDATLVENEQKQRMEESNARLVVTQKFFVGRLLGMGMGCLGTSSK